MPALYHCHKCNQQCTVTCENNGELKCTRCNESFVERISDTQAGGDGPTSSTAAANRVPSGPRVEVNPFGMFPTSPFSQLFQNVAQQLPDPDTQPTTSSAAAQRSGSGGALATRGNGPPPPNQDQQPSGSQAQQQQAEEEEDEDQPQGADDNETMVRLLHGVFVNIVDQATGVGEAANAAAPGPSNDAAAVTPSGRNVAREPINNNNGAGGGGGGLVARGPAIFVGRGQGHMPVHRPGNMEARLRSDIGNYAFGPNGLDDILTQLLNEASEAEERARALQPEDILRIPMLTVTEEHVINDAQCSTCMDNFIMGEEVAKLDCEHIFHLPCIQPWFERKNTCPICRKEVDPSKWPPAAGPPNNGEGSSGGGGGGGEPKLTE